MTSLIDEIRAGGGAPAPDPAFPHAPEGWTRARALETAKQEGLQLGDEHWTALRALQEYYARHETPGVNMRELHDALDEKFHARGGIRHLYALFPGGPIAQGCRIAGLKAPAGALDRGFGSVA
ncbi:MAG: TusE/DsrC/DsvC family sulfur relay protein [Betaproteobacteria bacterium]|nr:TusE/DsrC/DsvC family sulfur relay protein [Betaproteobacteria bacterium]